MLYYLCVRVLSDQIGKMKTSLYLRQLCYFIRLHLMHLIPWKMRLSCLIYINLALVRYTKKNPSILTVIVVLNFLVVHPLDFLKCGGGSVSSVYFCCTSVKSNYWEAELRGAHLKGKDRGKVFDCGLWLSPLIKGRYTKSCSLKAEGNTIYPKEKNFQAGWQHIKEDNCELFY